MNKTFTGVRKARIDEIQALSKLALESKAYWGYDEEFMNKCIPLLTIKSEDYMNTVIFLIEENKEILGFYQLREINKTDIDLDKFFIAPNSIKKGIGRQLFTHAKEKAKELGYKTMLIESDPNASRFYEKQGGKFIGFTISQVNLFRKLPNYSLSLLSQT